MEKVSKLLIFFLPFWFGLLFFLAQISASLKSIPTVLVLISIFFLPQVKQKFFQVIKKPWCQAAMILFALVCLGSFWGPASTALKFNTVKQYSKLLYLPFFTMGLSYSANRTWVIQGFLSAMVLTAILSIGAYFGLLTKIDFDCVFFNHIMTGFAMTFAACLSLFSIQSAKGKSRILYLFLFILFTVHVLFINLGRTGYVLYFVMLSLYILLTFPWKQCLVGILLFTTGLLGAYSIIPSIHSGVNAAISDYRNYSQNKDTSIGYRMQFHIYALDLLKRHPLFGNGTASFPTLSKIENPSPTFGIIEEPHGIYWLVGAEFGLLGLLALFVFFISLLLEAYTLKLMKIPALIFILSFMTINLTDSLLYYSGSGYIFVLFLAYFLSGNLIKTEQVPELQTHLSPLGFTSA